MTKTTISRLVGWTVSKASALGRFEDLLSATAKSPAMLFYLDNAQSVMPWSHSPLTTHDSQTS